MGWPTDQGWDAPPNMTAWWLASPTFERLLPSVLARIASHLMSVPLSAIEEVRACVCLGPVTKPFPFRRGETHFAKDPRNSSDLRLDTNKCPLDLRDGIIKGCLKQYLAHAPGKKRPIPNFAAASKTLYKNWRDTTAYVFCCEACMHNLILGLPKHNKRMITRARFYERDNNIDIEGRTRETFLMGSKDSDGWEDWLTYETNGNERVDYLGQKIWVKELVLPEAEV
jgi:hypothetical protein